MGLLLRSIWCRGLRVIADGWGLFAGRMAVRPLFIVVVIVNQTGCDKVVFSIIVLRSQTCWLAVSVMNAALPFFHYWLQE